MIEDKKFFYTKIYAVITTILLIVTLSACETFSAPKAANFSSAANGLKEMYCSDGFSDLRGHILAKIRETHPEYPEHGFCGFRTYLNIF